MPMSKETHYVVLNVSGGFPVLHGPMTEKEASALVLTNAEVTTSSPALIWDSSSKKQEFTLVNPSTGETKKLSQRKNIVKESKRLEKG